MTPVSDSTSPSGAWAIGLATTTSDGRVLDTWFPAPALAAPGEIGSLAGADGASVPGTVRAGYFLPRRFIASLKSRLDRSMSSMPLGS